MALDYDKYPILGRPPQTMHEHFRVEPLGCESFSEYMRLRLRFATNPQGATSFRGWLDDRIWELLQRQGQIDFFVAEAPSRTYWAPLFGTINPATVAECILAAATEWTGASRRVVLMDGTIVMELADVSGASTDQPSNPEARAGAKRRGKRKGGARQG